MQLQSCSRILETNKLAPEGWNAVLVVVVTKVEAVVVCALAGCGLVVKSVVHVFVVLVPFEDTGVDSFVVVAVVNLPVVEVVLVPFKPKKPAVVVRAVVVLAVLVVVVVVLKRVVVWVFEALEIFENGEVEGHADVAVVDNIGVVEVLPVPVARKVAVISTPNCIGHKWRHTLQCP